jgi:opacity protein-like surface antigen
MKKVFLTMLSICFVASAILAQDAAKPKTNVSVVATNGLVGAAYSPSGSSVFLTFGGPGLKCTTGKISFGVAMYPSLRVRTDAAQTSVSGILGGGFNIGYDRFSIIVPFYLTGKSASGTPNVEMAPAFGLAVRIGK